MYLLKIASHLAPWLMEVVGKDLSHFFGGRWLFETLGHRRVITSPEIRDISESLVFQILHVGAVQKKRFLWQEPHF